MSLLADWRRLRLARKRGLVFKRSPFRDFFGLSVERGIPRLHVHERFEREVTWGLRILTVAGIVTSVLSFRA